MPYISPVMKPLRTSYQETAEAVYGYKVMCTLVSSCLLIISCVWVIILVNYLTGCSAVLATLFHDGFMNPVDGECCNVEFVVTWVCYSH